VNERDGYLRLAIELADEARQKANAGNHERAQSYAAVAQAYASIVQAWGDYQPSVPEQRAPAKPLPEWCGECEGPEPGRRIIDGPDAGGLPTVKWCPRCEPRSWEYQASHAAPTEG